jgi:adenylosuccinate synthase
MRGVPCAWVSGAELFIGAGAVLNADLLEKEMLSIDYDRPINVDRHATIITHEHEHAERELVKAIGSTGEGVGQARIAKIKRDGSALLAKDHEFKSLTVAVTDTVSEITKLLKGGKMVMLEGTQGSGLSLHHGSYPHVTSSDTNASGMAAEAGIAPGYVTNVHLVARTHPIRVAGPSGPMGKELDWTSVPVQEPERTTVTNKVRRIAEWNDEQFARAVALNAPVGIWLTFADYIDPAVRGETNAAKVMASPAVREFVQRIEREHSVPVLGLGVGGDGFKVVHLSKDLTGADWSWS